jgi:ApaG protein
VDGPGVIGLYPSVYPGSYFEYESCCSCKTKTGSMKGSFNMKSELGHSFDIVVPEFFFVTPKFYVSSK